MSDVLNQVANRFDSGATLTHESAKAALAAGLQRIAAGARGVDCAPLTQFDSSALAVLLAWVRAAAARAAASSKSSICRLVSPVSRRPMASIRFSLLAPPAWLRQRDIDAPLASSPAFRPVRGCQFLPYNQTFFWGVELAP
ncbi:ABC-type transporter Mla MlaB component [Paraburkholderia atlantica]